MFWMYLWLWIWSLLPLLAVVGAGIVLGLYLGLMNPLQLPAGWDFGEFWSEQWNWQGRPGLSQDWDKQFGEFFANNQSQIAVIAAVAVGTLLLAALLLIPWINRSYAYRQTRWILGDNPRIGHRRALRLSRQMMTGHKFDTFVLDLSFLGWYILDCWHLSSGWSLLPPITGLPKPSCTPSCAARRRTRPGHDGGFWICGS